MGKKLFVGSLSWGTRDEGLREAFEAFGEVAEATVILERDTGRSRGFGFVTFEDDQAAQTAIAGWTVRRLMVVRFRSTST